MARVRKYRIWCVTENRYVFEWSINTPTQCPNNSADIIDPSNIVAIQGAGKPRLTADGDTTVVRKDKAELTGNVLIMKRIDAELAPQAIMTKEWIIPFGKTWRMRLFASSVMAYEVESRLEFYIPNGQSGFVRANPFGDYADEPIAVLKLDANSDSAPFFEGLHFVGDGSSKLRMAIENKDALDSVEASAYFNGYEADSIQSSSPTIDTPLSAGAVTVSGTSAESDGTTVQVYVNLVVTSAPVLVTGGIWTLGGLPALAAADTVQAKSTVLGKDESGFSNKVIVV